MAYVSVNSKGQTVQYGGCDICHSSYGCLHCDPYGIYRAGPILGSEGMWPSDVYIAPKPRTLEQAYEREYEDAIIRRMRLA